jgi:hypothetical protein
MGGHPPTEIPCVLCSKPVDLTVDLYADESGKAVHSNLLRPAHYKFSEQSIDLDCIVGSRGHVSINDQKNLTSLSIID